MTVPIVRSFLTLACSALLVGCLGDLGNLAKKAEPVRDGYQYAGEKYAQVTVTLSDDAKAAIRRDGRLARLNLDTEIVSALKIRDVYDPRGRGTVEVTVERVSIGDRSAAVTLRTVPGPDQISGEVRLLHSGVEVNRFPVTAQYQVGIFRKWSSSRTDWLSRKFAEITGNRIGGKAPRTLFN